MLVSYPIFKTNVNCAGINGLDRLCYLARWALVVGVVAMAAWSGARADVRAINLNRCSGSCVPAAIGEQDDAEASITLSRFGGDTLIFDPKAMPAALADGLPSPLASASGEAPGARGVSPYAFFADVIDVPYSADARGFAAVSSIFFTLSLAGTLSDFVWTSHEVFEPHGDIASRLGVPLSADDLWQPMPSRVRNSVPFF